MALPIDPAQMKDIAQNGAPAILHAVGRFVGLGEEERKALSMGQVPWWTWLLGGVTIGVVAGARIQRRWPGKLPALIRGK